MMVTSEETIKRLREEILRLKLEVLRLQRVVERNDQNMDETRQDLIANLIQDNDSLRKRIEELEENEQFKNKEPEYETVQEKTVDVSCETKMSSADINVLLQRSITLKNREDREQELSNHIAVQEEQIGQQMQQIQLLRHQEEQLKQQIQRLQHQDEQLKQQIQQIQHFQHKPPPQTGQMTADERASLDKLFQLNGRLTTARDRLRARFDQI